MPIQLLLFAARTLVEIIPHDIKMELKRIARKEAINRLCAFIDKHLKVSSRDCKKLANLILDIILGK